MKFIWKEIYFLANLQNPMIKKDDSIVEYIDDSNLPGFDYEIAYHPKRAQLLIKVLSKGKPITGFERFGIDVLRLQDRYSTTQELDPSHRHFVQNLLRFAHRETAEGYFVAPLQHVAFFLSRLCKFKKVGSLDFRQKWGFSQVPLVPLLSLTSTSLKPVQLECSFQKEGAKEIYPYSAVKVFAGNKSWVLNGATFYAIKITEANTILGKFLSDGTLSLRGKLAVEFVEEILPSMTKRGEIGVPKGFVVPKVIRPEPQTIYKFTEDVESERLILILRFSYGGYSLAPSENDDDLLAEVDEGGVNCLVCRDLAFEKEVLEKFYTEGFKRTGPDRFEILGEDALDFVAEELPELKNNPSYTFLNSVNRFQVFGQVGREELKAKAHSISNDWFSLDLGYDFDGVQVPFELVRSLVAQGRNYIPVPGKGYVKVKRDEILSIADKLAELEAELDDQGRLKLRRFHAPYLDGLLNIDWSEQQSFSEAIHALKQTGILPHHSLPAPLQSILRGYQQHGYDWLNFLHTHHFHGILADDMGLGKTLQMLAFLQDQKDKNGIKPNLVIAPTSVVFNWQRESEKFTPDLKVLVHSGSSRAKDIKNIEELDIVLTSYALFRRDSEMLMKKNWRCVVLDEAQNIKNYRSKTAQLVKELQADQRWAVTGTPLENRLSELWSIFSFLMPGFLGNYNHFKNVYQQPIEIVQDEEVLERLRKRIYPFIMRRLKGEVARELPPKTEITQYCEMVPEQKKLYQQMLMACREEVFDEVEKNGIERSQVSIFTALLRLRQICCHPSLIGKKKDVESGKMLEFEELLLEILSENHRVLVFSQFVEMLTLLKALLEKNNIEYEYLDGRTRNREKHIHNFQNNEKVKVFLISLRAGGTGINLTAADYVIHYDPWWNPAVEDQATDRVHRLGQTRHVFAYKMITKDSVEEKILGLQEKKKSLARGILSADSAMGKKFNVEDLEFLFS